MADETYIGAYPVLQLWNKVFGSFTGWYGTEKFYLDKKDRSLYLQCHYVLHCKIIAALNTAFIRHGWSYDRITVDIPKDRTCMTVKMHITCRADEETNMTMIKFGKITLK
jgi:hypothetical protein